MKLSFKSASSALVAALFVTSLAYVPVAEARPGGGGGHGGGGGGHAARGGGAHPGGGAGGRQVDARANNVRSSSVNNVNASNRNTNINKNVNVNVNNNNRGGGWDNDYHPIATAAAVTATVAVTSAVIGSMVRTVPTGCVPVNYGGLVYQQCGTTWYQPQGAQFVVIAPPY